MKKVVPAILILIGSAFLISAVLYWAKPAISNESRDLAQFIWSIFKFLLGAILDYKGLTDSLKQDRGKITINKNIRANQYIEKMFVNQPEPTRGLSTLPSNIRPGLDIHPIGREKELTLLKSINGDTLLIGQPGSGKTFLFYQLAKEGLGLFVNTNDSSKVIRDYEEKRPNSIFIDDAQVQTNIINDLIRFRMETGSKFYIIASCWPSSKDKIMGVLNIPESNTITLDLLTQDEIVQVIYSVGFNHPDFLVQEIVNQAVGRPGLAVTLTDMCLKGDAKDVYFGDILTRTLSKYLLEEIGERASLLLAAFSVSGSEGLPIEVVADNLGLNTADIITAATKLASSGIILEKPNYLLVAYPPALREVLVRDVFFGKAPKLDIRPFISHVSELGEVCLTLLGARSRGGAVPTKSLLDMMKELNNPRIWEIFAYLGREEAILTINNCQHIEHNILSAVLENSPDHALPLLFESATGDNRPLNSTPDHSLRIIEGWIKSAQPNTVAAIDNRKTLLEEIIKSVTEGKHIKTSISTLKFVMSPDYQELKQAPGSGNKAHIFSDTLSFKEIKGLEEFWPKIRDLLIMHGNSNWETVQAIVETWAYPGRHQKIDPIAADEMNAFAAVMMENLMPLLKTRKGSLHWAYHLSKSAGLATKIQLDEYFEILYPGKDFSLSSDERKDKEKEQVQNVQRLALEFEKLGITKSIEILSEIESEVLLIGHAWPRWTPYLCIEIAKLVNDPLLWLSNGLEKSLPPELISPFLSKAIDINDSDWIGAAYVCLQDERYKAFTVYLILTKTNIPENIIEYVLATCLDGTDGIIETACIRGEIASKLLLRLITCNNKKVVKAVIEGTWHASNKNIGKELLNSWKLAVTETELDDYLLREIFTEFPELAEPWLQKRIFNVSADDMEKSFNLRVQDSIKVATIFLNQEARKRILYQIDDTPYATSIVLPLIGNDTNLYYELLRKSNKKDLHLMPLHGGPSNDWVKKVKIALDFGYTTEEITHSIRWGSFSEGWTGKESKMWSDWISKLEPFTTHKDEAIRKIIDLAINEAKQNMNRALDRERQEEVFGRRSIRD